VGSFDADSSESARFLPNPPFGQETTVRPEFVVSGMSTNRVTCRLCERSRPAIVELIARTDDPDGELQGGWRFDDDGWTCPMCFRGARTAKGWSVGAAGLTQNLVGRSSLPLKSGPRHPLLRRSRRGQGTDPVVDRSDPQRRQRWIRHVWHRRQRSAKRMRCNPRIHPAVGTAFCAPCLPFANPSRPNK
jgi:hypothetical protein